VLDQVGRVQCERAGQAIVSGQASAHLPGWVWAGGTACTAGYRPGPGGRNATCRTADSVVELPWLPEYVMLLVRISHGFVLQHDILPIVADIHTQPRSSNSIPEVACGTASVHRSETCRTTCGMTRKTGA
jgi:hypothetical protein